MVTALDSLLYPKAGSRTCHHAIAGIPAIWCFWRWWWQWCGGGREIRLSRLLPSQVAAVIVSIEIVHIFRLGELSKKVGASLLWRCSEEASSNKASPSGFL